MRQIWTENIKHVCHLKAEVCLMGLYLIIVKIFLLVQGDPLGSTLLRVPSSQMLFTCQTRGPAGGGILALFSANTAVWAKQTMG